MQTTAVALSLLTAVAFGVLTTAGLLLWKRARSIGTALVTLGFAILLLDQVILLVSYHRMIDNLRSHSDDTLFVIYHRANSLRVALLGLWFAAIGLVWHALQGSRRSSASPNNRWRGP